MKMFQSDEYKNWTTEDFYSAILSEVVKESPDWNGNMNIYVAGYYLKSGKRMNGSLSYDGLIQELKNAESTGEFAIAILAKYGIIGGV